MLEDATCVRWRCYEDRRLTFSEPFAQEASDVCEEARLVTVELYGVVMRMETLNRQFQRHRSTA